MTEDNIAAKGLNGHSSHRDSERAAPLRVLIIGAGLGGLTAALALRRAGHTVILFEQSSLASEFGAAINVPPNANGILRRLGVDAAAVGAVEWKYFTEYNKDGSSVKVIDFAKVGKIWQHTYLLAHRVDLHTQLKDAATSVDGIGTPAELRTSSKVARVDTETGSLTLSDGTVVKGDLIIGADGIHSKSRATLTEAKPFPSGKSAYRFLIDRADALAIPEVAKVVEKEGEMMMWFDVARRIVTYPTRNNSILNFVCIHPDNGSGSGDTWNEPGTRANLLKEYEGFDERALRLLELADEATLKVWKLMDMAPVENWCKDKFCVIGDAAHPFLPYQGQGGAQALEDGVALGVMLPLGVSPEEVPARLQLYESARRQRAETVQDFTRQSGADVKEGQEDNSRHVMAFFQYNCGHDEYDHSTQQLRDWTSKQQQNVRWRMPIGFGPSPSPRQDFQGHAFNSSHSAFTTRSVKFKTSRTLLQNLLPTPQFSFVAPDTFAEASYVQTTLKDLDWLGGQGYNYVGFYLHGVQYTKKDGSSIIGDYLAVMWEDLTDPILTGRDEIGFPKLYSEIQIEGDASAWSMKASWRNTTFLSLELNGLQAGEVPPPSTQGVLAYKYIPATGQPGVADAEYAVCAPPSTGNKVNSFRRAAGGAITVNKHDTKSLPTLHHIVQRLAELPVYEIVEGTVAEGTGLDDLSSAHRIELASK